MVRTLSPRRVVAILSVLAAVAAVQVGTVLPAAAVPPTVTPSASTVPEARDYASENWADPWDYANAADLSLTPNVASSSVSNLTMVGGNLAFDAAPGGYVVPANGSGVFAHDRDADIHPIDANTFTRLSFRMWSGASTTQPGGIFWFNCDGGVPSCQGAMSFAVQPGWNTYDLALTPNLPGAMLPWSGPIKALRLVPSGSSNVHVELDWMRAYRPSGGTTLTVTGGTANEVWWDADSDTSNNTPSSLGGKGAGILATNVPSGGTVTFPSSAYPPGTYRFFTKQSGASSAYSAPVVVDARPQPVVVNPDLAGGDDYATVVRGDPWDFNQPSDGSVSNASASFGGGVLTGSFGGPRPGDPQVDLPIAGPIDARLYHRLTYKIRYDGPFGLADAPGGGMVARLIWTVDQAGVPGYHDSQDMIVYPGSNTVSVDLKSTPPSAAEDESSSNPIGWGGPASGSVSSIRFDPHEDPGGRTWYLDDIKLARNDRGKPNFDITFQDNAWESGTTAELWADSDAAGFDGTKIASAIPVTSGLNTYTWNGKGLPAGTYWIYLVLRDPAGTTSRSYSSGPVDMSPPPVNPFGSLDSVQGAPGGLLASGWAIDPDTAIDQPIDVHLYLDGNFAKAVSANQSRPDVGAAVPGYGTLHGYSTTVPAGPGSHTLCAYGINVGPGGNSLLGCRSASVPSGSPFGSLDGVSAGAPGKINLSGWALDPDAANSIDVHVYVNGLFAGVVNASANRPDVGSFFPGYGALHGFNTAVTAAAGTNNVCAYGINVGAGGNALLGCKTVTLPVNPFGSVDGVSRSGSTLTVSGWAIDPDTAGAIAIHVYVDGAFAGQGTANTSRPDLLAFYPAYGAAHGYSVGVPAAAGLHTVCVYGINVAAGGNALIGCRTG